MEQGDTDLIIQKVPGNCYQLLIIVNNIIVSEDTCHGLICTEKKTSPSSYGITEIFHIKKN